MIASSCGDVGDCICLGAILQKIPNAPHTLVIERSDVTKFKTESEADRLVSLIRPLFIQQGWCEDVRRAMPGEKIDWRSAGFREAPYIFGASLIDAHVVHLRKVLGLGDGIRGQDQWLGVVPSPLSNGRVVINRTGRYRNGYFPWDRIVRHYSWRLLFIGLHHEYREFCSHYGYVDYQPTANMLEVAELIAGSELFIGNQSSANWVAEGLKHPMIQEVCQMRPDCVIRRDNAQHVVDGEVRLPAIEDMPEKVIPCGIPEVNLRIQTNMRPPKGWVYPNLPSQGIFRNQVDAVVKLKGITPQEAHAQIIMYTQQETPGFFPASERQEVRRNFEVAYENSVR